MILTVLFAPPNVYLSIPVITGVYGKNSKWNQTAALAVINDPLKECSLLLIFRGETFAFSLYLLKHVCRFTFLTEKCVPSHFPCWNMHTFHFPCPRLDGVSQDQFPIGIYPSSPFLLSQVLNGQYHSVTFLFTLSLYNLLPSQPDSFQSWRWRPHIPLPHWYLSAFISCFHGPGNLMQIRVSRSSLWYLIFLLLLIL
jgi:hypothetical protein